jgi:hypothetical protein
VKRVIVFKAFILSPYTKLETQMAQRCFLSNNCQRRYQHLGLGKNKSYFVRVTLILKKNSEKWHFQNADRQHVSCVYEQTIEIQIGTNCVLLPADLLLNVLERPLDRIRSILYDKR